MSRRALLTLPLPFTLCLAVLVGLLPADTSAAEADSTTRGMLAYLIAHSAVAEEVVPTRGTLAYLIAHSVGGLGDFEPPTEPTYPDVPQDNCAYAEIEYVTWLEVMQGYSDGLFHPEWNQYRAAAAVYTARVIDLTDGDLDSYVPPASPTFPDVPVAHWAYQYVEYLVVKGIPIAAADGMFRPEALMDVYELAAWLEAATGTYVDPGSYPCIPEVLTVCIDIKPGTYPNAINLNGMGRLALAISDADVGCLDPAELDVSTLTLAGAPVATRKNGSYMVEWETVESGMDRIEVLVAHFNVQELGLCVGDEVGVLEGLTWDGVPVRGEDSVWVFIRQEK